MYFTSYLRRNFLFSQTGIIIGRKARLLGDNQMREFDYSKLKERTWDNEILAYVAQIHEFKGKQDLYLRQKPVELNRLVEIAKIQSRFLMHSPF